MTLDERREYRDALKAAKGNLQRAEAIQEGILNATSSTAAAQRLGSIQAVLRSMEALI